MNNSLPKKHLYRRKGGEFKKYIPLKNNNQSINSYPLPSLEESILTFDKSALSLFPSSSWSKPSSGFPDTTGSWETCKGTFNNFEKEQQNLNVNVDLIFKIL